MTRLRRLRDTFDEVADLYHLARPPYPDELVDDLLSETGIGPGCRVLEIGCGSGQITAPLARSGAEILALEVGPNLAAAARQRLRRYKNVQVLNRDFDAWSIPACAFDLVVVATAFHWLNPVNRVSRCEAALRPSGVLVIIDTHWGVGPVRDEFSEAVQSCYAEWDPHHKSDFQIETVDTLPSIRKDVEESQGFRRVVLQRYTVEHEYPSARYRSLVGTFSNVRALERPDREGLIRCIGDLIDSKFGGSLIRCDTYSMWLAHKLN